MGTITTGDGKALIYKDLGTGRPVVFHHGWPLSADAGLLSARIIPGATLKVYPGYPHDMATVQAEHINADRLAFIQG